jgi:hypothetical protein
VEPVGPLDERRVRPWATVLRVPHRDGLAWFKACAPVQAFEPRLTAGLFARWPDRVTEVLARDEERAWLLLADAGTPISELGNSPEIWLAALPLYAELQRGEAARAEEHLAHGVPDLRVATLPARYENLLRQDLPLESAEVERLRAFAGRFAELCEELAHRGIPETVQHDDLHHRNLYLQGDLMRVIDWGDSSISHPFQTMYITLAFLKLDHGLADGEPALARIRDAYLEPWSGLLPRNELLRSFRLAEKLAAVSDVLTEERVVTANRLEPSPDDRRAPARMLRGLLDVL